MADTPGYTITLHDPRHDTDDEIAERVAFSNAYQAEVLPDDPPTPVDQAIASERAMPERIRRWSFRAKDASGRLVGVGGTSFDPDHDDNPDLFEIRLVVAADHRRRGLGAQLFERVVQLAREEGRTRLIGNTNERLPNGSAFARAIGAESKQQMHLNHLPIEAVDRSMLEKWVADGPVRATGYELFTWDGHVSDEHMDAYLDIWLVMNTAPRDDLAINDFTITAEQIREWDKIQEAAGIEHWTVVARRVSDGAWAGFHDVTWDPASPTIVWVGATGVRPEHRGYALGKWLKAHMTLRILDERPQVVDIRTGNADSNDAMLGINKEMGYRGLVAGATWEIPVAEAETWLAARNGARVGATR